MDLKEMEVLGDDAGQHWYYASKALAMQSMLGAAAARRVLDIGAGSGFFSKYLLENSAADEAWCIDPSYSSDTDEVWHGKPLHFRRQVEASPADLVLLMDVLEHVDDDVGLVKEYAAKVPTGCRFLVTVPAFQALWSGHDDFLEHRRRYTLSQVETVLRDAGLRVGRGCYFFGCVLPLAAVLRLSERLAAPQPARSQLQRHSPPVNAILRSICSMEVAAMRLNRVGGLTVVCTAEKM